MTFMWYKFHNPNIHLTLHFLPDTEIKSFITKRSDPKKVEIKLLPN